MISPMALALVVACATLTAQTAWTQRTGPSPDVPTSHALAYDSARGRMVMFGMAVLGVAVTWEWDGSKWDERKPASRPSARQDHAMVFDSKRAKVILFGGSRTSDTWEWDGTNWTQLNPPLSPPARDGHAMAYDSRRDRVVLFSGSNGLSDLWEWDGTNWIQRFPPFGPNSRLGHVMTYDSARGRVVMWGGASQNLLLDTWEWDGDAWTRIAGAQPSDRWFPCMTYDSARRRAVLFGGCDLNFKPLSDTWEWNGSTWVQRACPVNPPGRRKSAVAYDSRRECAVLFGGYGSNGLSADTWEYAPTNLAASTAFGTGCPAGSSSPALVSDAGSLPWIGATYSARLVNLGASAAHNPAFIMLGDSKTQWGTTPLPLDLGFISMPGCLLYTNPILTNGLTNTSGTATWFIPLPQATALVGSSLFVQGGVRSPAANLLGVAMSNGCELKIGAK